MSYLVLARKYRPQSFDDLIGQEHVARTLANAIRSGRVAHAFLFTGVRGVGKTTSARLLAKCLNCVGPTGELTAPTPTPCQVCPPCKEIAAGNDIDVQEIDGASYNGVDEVRRLQEGIAFRPARDRFKTYIVDEVHMLSTAAWNAFLKTLEEPPPHVKFIFATTEVHKVPVTILSRCQRYDFKLIPTLEIAKRIQKVLELEHIQADGGSVATLAREAAGSMRDAMSLLDQVIAYSGERLTADDVARVLGVADRKVLHELAAGLVGGDAAACLRVLDGMASQGFDLPHVARDVLRHLRDLVVANVCGEGGRDLLDLADEEARDVLALATKSDADDLARLFQGFSSSFDDIAKSGQPRAALEMTLVRLARRPPLVPIDDLMASLADLEKRLGGAPSPPRTGSPPTGPRSAPQGPKGSSLATAQSAPPGWSRAAAVDRTEGALALAAPPPEPILVPVSPDATTPTPPPSSATSPVSPELSTWRAIVDRVRAVRPSVAAVLEHGVPIAMGPERVLVAYPPDSFLGAQASEPEALELLTREVRAYFGAPTQVGLDLSRKAKGPSVAAVDAEEHAKKLAEARASVEGHPLVKEAIRVLGAELREVRLPSDE